MDHYESKYMGFHRRKRMGYSGIEDVMAQDLLLLATLFPFKKPKYVWLRLPWKNTSLQRSSQRWAMAKDFVRCLFQVQL